MIGERLGGGGLLGGTLYELPPGEKTWPYHYELGCEEWLVVVSGRPTLRAADGERVLEPGDGPEGAHQLENRTGDTCRILLLSSKAPVAIVRYPDSGKTGLWTQSDGYLTILRDEPSLDYWEGEA